MAAAFLATYYSDPATGQHLSCVATPPPPSTSKHSMPAREKNTRCSGLPLHVMSARSYGAGVCAPAVTTSRFTSSPRMQAFQNVELEGWSLHLMASTDASTTCTSSLVCRTQRGNRRGMKRLTRHSDPTPARAFLYRARLPVPRTLYFIRTPATLCGYYSLQSPGGYGCRAQYGAHARRIRTCRPRRARLVTPALPSVPSPPCSHWEQRRTGLGAGLQC
jgi:hypothetical protein